MDLCELHLPLFVWVFFRFSVGGADTVVVTGWVTGVGTVCVGGGVLWVGGGVVCVGGGDGV
jgi:hypothetical protein